jgi:heme-degrading monooxygenase HmoA
MLHGSSTRRRSSRHEEVAVVISRIWHGCTAPGDADTYGQLLRDEVFTAIAGRNIEGFREIQLFRRPLAGEVEFVTVMWFDSLDAVRRFAGSDYELAVVPAAARSVLSRFDERSRHCEVRGRRSAE